MKNSSIFSELFRVWDRTLRDTFFYFLFSSLISNRDLLIRSLREVLCRFQIVKTCDFGHHAEVIDFISPITYVACYCSGGSQNFPEGTPTAKREHQPIIWSIFLENCMKMKKFWARGGGGGGHIPRAPLDPPMYCPTPYLFLTISTRIGIPYYLFTNRARFTKME